MIKEKAQEFASKLHIDNFSGSNGWLEGVKKRNDIAFKNVCGESNSVDNNECNEWIKNLPALLHDYSPDDVFNADEACVFYKCLPDKIFTFKGQSCHGGKLSKDWVTELVSANMSGTEKLPLLLIGKSKSPRCFKDVLKSIEENKSPEINILQAMRFARKACFSLSKTTISNCFQKAGFKVTNVSDPESLQEELEICAAFPERDRIFTTCRNDLNEQQVNFQDFVSMDDNVLISEKLNDDDIVAMYSSLDTEEEEEDCEETPVKI
ncbi:jg15871 [Pararge aegeria aegeria]|uniref:Jg15871 protein n=1 Tax=Pararge aegeria aegeria TaxID=348720 RepID=A0A8S4QU80_9NEOP|nr:jg15871 [Pararge aegeria aegeria]